MPKPPRTSRPQAAIDIAHRIDAAIYLIGAWTNAHALVKELYQPIEILDNIDAAKALIDLQEALTRNPPKQAIDLLARFDEMHREMDALDASVKNPSTKSKPQ